ncbi:hypothetical protein ASPNIDRAFT_170177 [Aspergillus niger ATCC 1015]|uniref:MADS-box domain-containing protein n=2 Tax=Aspergillus subgen. Circumdati TaxID=2720871 RepID=G3XQH4_ASPNA|nr:hypothetical protein ASPNIDRAFT_170177 [Aspergillus niger ATCC 1015]OJZ80012.1 hypothetical protein ASPFODRAFT_65981 [Aspergillus luchuensis CBS 106.47]
MAAKKRSIRRRRSSSKRSTYQQRNRRRNSLFLKAFEYCNLCEADIALVIRLKHNGQVFKFNSNSQWHPSREELVGNLYNSLKDMSYPKPREITWCELAAQYEIGEAKM